MKRKKKFVIDGKNITIRRVIEGTPSDKAIDTAAMILAQSYIDGGKG